MMRAFHTGSSNVVAAFRESAADPKEFFRRYSSGFTTAATRVKRAAMLAWNRTGIKRKIRP
jgi:hypothetical protein